ncbi:ankyrin [Aureobasidium subglaciale]|nr:ankyrin [Aureobasidium subglaciale]
MLGRLSMSVDECIKAYMELSQEVFHPRRRIFFGIRGNIKERYDSKALELAVKKVLRDRNMDEEALLQDLTGTKVGETSETSLLRSWNTIRGDEDLYKTVRIWEAARATSAASTYFDPISIGDPKQRFLDGGTGANNPVHDLWGEATDLLSRGQRLSDNLGCLISIGTGQPGFKPVVESVLGTANMLLNIASETEATANLFRRDKSDLFDRNICFRFNVPRGLGDIDLAETEQLGAIKSMTLSHLQTEAVQSEIRRCVERLGERQFVPLSQASSSALQTIDRVNQDEDQDYYELSQDPCWQLANHEKVWQVKLPVDFWNRNAAIEFLVERSEGPVVHFYFDPDKHDMLTTEDLLRSYVKQLLRHTHRIKKRPPLPVTTAIKRMFGTSTCNIDCTELVNQVLRPLIHAIGQTFLIVDGLDLCPTEEYKRALSLLSSLLEDPWVMVIVCGRDELEVDRRIAGSSRLEVPRAGQHDDVAKFITDYIGKRTADDGPISDDPETVERIRRVLVDQAKEMFLWARLQIDVLWDTCTTDAQIDTALSALPKTLNETYERCLRRVQKKQQQYSLRVLRYVYEANSPMVIDALGEALAIDPETGRLHDDDIPPNTVILQSGANLIVYDAVDRLVIPAHHSVRTYLYDPEANIPGDLTLPIWHDATLSLVDMCIIHLKWHARNTVAKIEEKFPREGRTVGLPLSGISYMCNAISTPNRAMAFLKNPSFALRKTLPVSKNSDRIHMRLGISDHATASASLRRLFHTYARTNWVSLSHKVTLKSASWSQFEDFVTENWQRDPELMPWTAKKIKNLGTKAFSWAVYHGHLGMLDLGMNLCRTETSKPLSDYDAMLPSHLAAKRGHFQVLIRLKAIEVGGFNLEVMSHVLQRMTILPHCRITIPGWVIKHDLTAAVSILVACKVNLNDSIFEADAVVGRSREGGDLTWWPALFFALEKSDPALATAFVKNGASLDASIGLPCMESPESGGKRITAMDVVLGRRWIDLASLWSPVQEQEYDEELTFFIGGLHPDLKWISCRSLGLLVARITCVQHRDSCSLASRASRFKQKGFFCFDLEQAHSHDLEITMAQFSGSKDIRSMMFMMDVREESLTAWRSLPSLNSYGPSMAAFIRSGRSTEKLLFNENPYNIQQLEIHSQSV